MTVVVTDVVTVEELVDVLPELLPLTVTVVTVFPSSEIIVLVSLNSFLFIIILLTL